jgi:catechol 2,3-dioxygenase-like lactoylglutathione lyase family enzyme
MISQHPKSSPEARSRPTRWEGKQRMRTEGRPTSQWSRMNAGHSDDLVSPPSHKGGLRMSVKLNHMIVFARDKKESAEFLTGLFALRAAVPFGPFLAVQVDDVTFDFDEVAEVTPGHYAFLVSESRFDEIFGRIQEWKLPYWADPFQQNPAAINRNDGGRGVYFKDPSGHLLEIITRPYGSG